MKKKTILKSVMLAFMIMLVTKISGQAPNNDTGYTISKEYNQPRHGDIIYIQKTNSAHIGDSGPDIIWNFSYAESQGNSTIAYQVIDSTIIKITDKGIEHFSLKGDSLLLFKQENQNKELRHLSPSLVNHYPIHYSDILNTTYAGEGKYCDRFFIREKGTIHVEADGYGSLVLPSADTLRNTTRICTITTTAIQMHKDSCKKDSDFNKHVVTEHYQWYSAGYRYPVFETIIQTSYNMMDPIASFQESYWLDLDSVSVLRDSVNEEIKRKEEKEYQKPDDIFHYSIRTENKKIIVDYDLDIDTNIRIIVADITGVLHKNIYQHCIADNGQSIIIDCNDMRHGQYIIYINVNGNIYSHNTKIK